MLIDSVAFGPVVEQYTMAGTVEQNCSPDDQEVKKEEKEGAGVYYSPQQLEDIPQGCTLKGSTISQW
jgi:hypothetical protein